MIRGSTRTTLPRHTRWTFRLGVNGSLTAVQLSNPTTSIITDAQLTRSQAISANISLDGRINADHPDYTWENTLTAKYGFVRTLDTMMSAMMAPSPINETADLLSLRSVFAWRGLRTRVPRLARAVAVRRALRRERVHQARRARVSSLGAATHRWCAFSSERPVQRVLRLRSVRGGARAARDFAAAQLPVVGSLPAGLASQPGTLFTLAGRDVQWDSTLDLAMRDVFRLPGMQLRGHLGFSFPLVGPLSLTVGYDLFVRYIAFERNAEGQTSAFGFANDLEVGLGLNWARAVQTFSR